MSCQTMPLKVAMTALKSTVCRNGRARFLYNRRRFSMRKQAAEKARLRFRELNEKPQHTKLPSKPQPSVPAAVGGKNETRSGGGNRRFS